MSTDPARARFENAMRRLKRNDAEGAVRICQAALQEAPDNVDLLTLLGSALLTCRRPGEAFESLQRAVALAPRFYRAREYLGQACLMTGRVQEAVEQLQAADGLQPGTESIQIKLAHALANLGQGEEADRVYEGLFDAAPDRRRLAEAGEHLHQGRLRQCAEICTGLLRENPKEVNALRMLAKVAGENEKWRRAERLLDQVLELAPGFHDARLDLARVYKQQDRVDDAVACAADTVSRSPHNAYALYVYASMLAIAQRHEEALEAYRQAIAVRAHHPPAYTGMGHLLKTLGRTEEGISAYRKAIEQRPDFGEVYWSLANLKTFRFSDEEVAEIERQLARDELEEDARVHFLFTLGKALEDRGEYRRAFSCYAEGADTQRMRESYDMLETRGINQRIRETFTRELLDEKKNDWRPEPMPVFIVGLPRSGSTLIEQILASHSQVEGTAELPDIGRVIGAINNRGRFENYPEAVAGMESAALKEYGELYLEKTARHRRGRPMFTDKMPNNFPSIGLIHLILPGARIIDARRHPLDSCFGSFKQLFAYGQPFTYDLEELADYFLEYRRMMRHWEAVLPGRVLEVRYEDMVRDQEGQTRRLLDYCGLEFEGSCLRFHETDRPVRTASSEQVRQPIYASSINRWRNFRQELAPLAEMLGEELEGWDA